MQAITTKYLGPTDTKGARVRATWKKFDRNVTVTVVYDHGSSTRDNHAYAAMKLVCEHVEDGNDWQCGEYLGGYIFVMGGEGYSRYFAQVRT